jgi:hypothetical protein
MTACFLSTLLDQASLPFLASGRFAYHFSRGKLGGDCIFRELLQRGIFPNSGHYLDLGCGQGSLFAWLLAARRLYSISFFCSNIPVWMNSGHDASRF